MSSDVIQAATSGRSKCRGCGRAIASGSLRFGESLPNPYAEGESLHWFHPLCAAYMRPEKLLGALERSAEPVLAERERLAARAQPGVLHPRLIRLRAAERAASGRAHCRLCRELMDKGRLRLSLQIFEDGRMNPIGSIHVGCAEAYFGTADILERIVELTPELDEPALLELKTMLAQQRPAPAIPEDTSPAAEGASGSEELPAPLAKTRPPESVPKANKA